MKRRLADGLENAMEEIRLPASTMLFSQAWPGDGLQEFQVRPGAGRWLQCRSVRALRLLRVPERGLSAEELHEACAARAADGVALGDRLQLLAPELLVVVDDDKRQGLQQQLITDVFLKMGLRA